MNRQLTPKVLKCGLQESILFAPTIFLIALFLILKEIKCEDCDHVYMGQTVRSFKTRRKEVLDSKIPSHLADHKLDNHHHTNINNIGNLHFTSKGKNSSY